MSNKIRLSIDLNSSSIDWKLCLYCQCKTATNDLICPASIERKNHDPEVTYQKIATNIEEFEVRNELPMVLLFDSFDKEDLAQKFITNKARFHKRWNNKFSDLKLSRVKEREQKRSSNEQEEIILEDNINSHEITRDTSVQECSSAKKTRPSSSSDSEKVKCFFCDSSEGTLHRVLKFQLDKRVRKCATILEEVDLLGKLNSGDMIACDAMHHSPCLLDLYRKSYGKENETVFDDTDKRIYGQVLAELVQYVEQVAKDENTYKFKLVNPAKL